MLITSFCQSVSSSLAHNLRLATSDSDRYLFARQALIQSERVLVALRTLLVEKGEQCEEYRAGRDAALDLLTVAGITFVRNCTMYSEGIQFLDELASRTNDTMLRKKLRIYANQLKKRWNDADPGGILHAPRAAQPKKVHTDDGRTLAPALMCIFIALVLGAVYLRVSPKMVAGRAEPQAVASAPTASRPPQQENAPPERPAYTAEEPAPLRTGDYCRYTDDSGVVHLVNNPAEVPQQYRSRLKIVAPVEGGAGLLTRVICRNNRVLVPVRLRYQGREVEAVLLLDTGATVTTINEAVAARLGVDQNAAQVGTSTVADGRVVSSYHFSSEILSVGPKAMSGAMISILPGSGGDGAEGLLGMNFLKEFRYHVDFNRGVIEWGG